MPAAPTVIKTEEEKAEEAAIESLKQQTADLESEIRASRRKISALTLDNENKERRKKQLLSYILFCFLYVSGVNIVFFGVFLCGDGRTQIMGLDIVLRHVCPTFASHHVPNSILENPWTKFRQALDT